MNAVIYWSNTGESLKIAKYISEKTGYELYELMSLKEKKFDDIFLVFPIHYQSIPKTIVRPLKGLKFHKAVLVLTYGKMKHGDVLNEAQNILHGSVVGGAYIPCKHTYLLNDISFNDYDKLDKVVEMIKRDTEAIFPRLKRNVFAKVLPNTRHRVSVKIIKTNKCTNCGKCNDTCIHINNGVINKKCIRCLKCVQSCPSNALIFKTSVLLKNYLKKAKKLI